MKAQHGHHVTPKKTLLMTFGALIVLTIVTAVTAQIELGPMNVPLALLIAGSKAVLVALIFMGLKYDNPVNGLVFSLGIVFVTIFLTFTLFDTMFRGDLGNVGSETISDIERRETQIRERETGLAAGESEETSPIEIGIDTTATDTSGAAAPAGTPPDTTAE